MLRRAATVALPADPHRLNRLRVASAAAAVVLLAFAVPLSDAQELSLLAGTTREIDRNNKTYAWELEYQQGLGEHAAVSISWLNEGHVPGHHRDGQSLQLWARTSLLNRRWWLSAGIGPYRYFDTAKAEQSAAYNVDHGWGTVFSLGSTWYSENRWLLHLRLNRIEAQDGFDTDRVLVGVGYQLDAPPTPGPRTRAPARSGNTTGNEVTVFLGATIVNSLESEHGVAHSIEYRRGIGRHVDWTVAWIDEGDVRLIRRNGIASQLWLTRAFFDDRFALGAGAGAYYAIDPYRDRQPDEDGDEAVAAIVTATASVRIDRRWLTRVSWNRIATDYSRDTDIILFGLGYRF